jgi:PBP1b-binding outer membrane lipoprotein LpoB
MKFVSHRVAVVLVLANLLTGCASYHLGSLLKGNYRTVAVVMLKNRTLQPQLESQVSNAIIKQFQSDGTLRVVSAADADIVLTGEITEYLRRDVRSARQDSGIPREYQITIVTKVQAVDRRTGKTILTPTVVRGMSATFIGNDLQTAEEQVLPLVAEDVGRQASRLLTESW